MFDVLGYVETGGNFQSQYLDVKTAASLDVVALQCAVGKSLRQVAASRKTVAGQRIVPVARGVGAAVVFTGTLESMVRRDAMQHVLDLGGHCTATVTKHTNLLVVGDQDFRKFTDGLSSSKMKAAQRLRAAGGDIELIAEDDFLRMLEPVASAVTLL